ncbi:MAG: hypothetical protein IT200_10015 [Thermoleophilia bacterium]|nr:hypothetical protein [Thermoleophilia bacterium]
MTPGRGGVGDDAHAASPGTPGAPPDGGAMRAAEREARDEAAPFATLAAALLLGLALVSHRAGWALAGGLGWWVWLSAAVPQVLLAVTLLAGLGAGVATRAVRRRTVQCLLALVLAIQIFAVALLVASLLETGTHIGGGQLLLSAVTVWLTDTVAFGLVLWELDCGGPVPRALRPRTTPDIQFPQDDNPAMARPGWRPGLVDYLYVSLTNSIAFSPTDAMPLTHSAKAVMALESCLSIVAILVVAARAVNILG